MKNDPISGVQKRLMATMARIRAQCAANEAEKREKAAALRWCRANGNPHLGELAQ